MFILFTLQGRENYGTAEEPRWKPKFASEYRLRISDEELLRAPNKAEFLRALADRAAKQLEQDNTHWISPPAEQVSASFKASPSPGPSRFFKTDRYTRQEGLVVPSN